MEYMFFFQKFQFETVLRILDSQLIWMVAAHGLEHFSLLFNFFLLFSNTSIIIYFQKNHRQSSILNKMCITE